MANNQNQNDRGNTMGGGQRQEGQGRDTGSQKQQGQGKQQDDRNMSGHQDRNKSGSSSPSRHDDQSNR